MFSKIKLDLYGVIVLTGLALVLSFVFTGKITTIDIDNRGAFLTAAGRDPELINETIQKSLAFLEQVDPLEIEFKRNGELSRRQINLAILEEKSGRIFEKRLWFSEDELRNYGKTGRLNLEPEADDGIDVELVWWNSFNSFFKIKQPGYIVAANRYLMPSRLLSGLPEKSEAEYTEISYSPYSRELHLPELVEAGKKYLNSRVEIAYEQLKKNKVASRSVPGRLATEAVNKELIKNIILVEHVDPDAFSVSEDNGRILTERVLVLLGANRERAYRYTGSPAGASGIGQFIKPTYLRLAQQYPRAGLIKNYQSGTADHVNAIKAMVLFFDSHAKDLGNRITRQDVLRQLGITEEMLAASYNGGPSRVVSSVNRYGLAWLSGQISSGRSNRIFRTETLEYLKKFQSIKNLNIF